MQYFAVYHPTHGIKSILATTHGKARDVFTRNNGGKPPHWIVPYSVKEHDTIRSMMRLGWNGTLPAFCAELGIALRK